jgi:hypothetical protein
MKKAILNRRSPSLIRSSTGSEGGPSQTTAPARPYEDELVLVVNDMQPGFAASADALTIYAIELQIRLAKAKNLPIIVVEYDAHEMGTTIPQIMRHLEGYARAVVVGKSDDDGSAEIFEAVIDNGFWPENYILCGVNSDACLLETVRGLIARVPTCRIVLFQDACNAENGKDCPVWHKIYPRMKNVILRLHGCH